MSSLGARLETSDRQLGARQAPPTAPGRPRPRGLLVVGDAAVDDRLLAGVDDDERQVDDRVGRRRPAGLLLHLAVPLHQVLEGNLLKKTHNWHTLIPAATQQLVSPWAYAPALPSPANTKTGPPRGQSGCPGSHRPEKTGPEPKAWRTDHGLTVGACTTKRPPSRSPSPAE